MDKSSKNKSVIEQPEKSKSSVQEKKICFVSREPGKFYRHESQDSQIERKN